MAIRECLPHLRSIGISPEDAVTLRLISMTLHRWHEMECGTDSGAIERDLPLAVERAAWPRAGKDRWWDGEKWNVISQRRTYERDEKEVVSATLPRDASWRETGEKAYLTWDSGSNGKRARRLIPDRERGALKRLAAIMARYPTLSYYVQGDPRGAALYIMRPGDVPEGERAESYYSRGIAVYK